VSTPKTPADVSDRAATRVASIPLMGVNSMRQIRTAKL
jgi:hypothetical protein